MHLRMDGLVGCWTDGPVGWLMAVAIPFITIATAIFQFTSTSSRIIISTTLAITVAATAATTIIPTTPTLKKMAW